MARRALLLLLVLGVAAASHAERHALLIGVADYAYDGITDLEGPENDVPALRRLLVERWGYRAEDVRTLESREATRARILAEVRGLLQRSSPGDHVFLYFSGHGTSRFDPKVQLPLPLTTGALVPADFEPAESARLMVDRMIVGRRDLRPILSELDAGRRQVLVAVDACFSEHATRSLYRSAVRQPRLPARFVSLPALGSLEGRAVFDDSDVASYEIEASSSGEDWPYQRVVSLAASGSREVAADINRLSLSAYPTQDGLPHGAFTDALLRVLSGKTGGDFDRDGRLSYAELARSIRLFMASRGYSQTPVAQPRAGDPRRSLLGRSVFENPDAAAVLNPPAPDPELRVKLGARAAGLAAALRGLERVRLVGERPDLLLERRDGDLLAIEGDGELLANLAAAGEEEVANWVGRRAWAERLLARSAAPQPFDLAMEPSGGAFAEDDVVELVVTQERDAVVVVLSIESLGAINVLYPANQAELQPRKAGDLLRFPSFRVVPPFGIEYVAVLAFPERPVGIEKVMGQYIRPERRESLTQLDSVLAAASGRYAQTSARLIVEGR